MSDGEAGVSHSYYLYRTVRELESLSKRHVRARLDLPNVLVAWDIAAVRGPAWRMDAVAGRTGGASWIPAGLPLRTFPAMKLALLTAEEASNPPNTTRDVIVTPMLSLKLQLGILAFQVRKLSHLVENPFTGIGKMGV